MSAKQHALEILRNSIGDDLERAKHAFSRYTETQMDEPYGQSGRTPRQILADYERHRALDNATIEWAMKVPE